MWWRVPEVVNAALDRRVEFGIKLTRCACGPGREESLVDFGHLLPQFLPTCHGFGIEQCKTDQGLDAFFIPCDGDSTGVSECVGVDLVPVDDSPGFGNQLVEEDELASGVHIPERV